MTQAATRKARKTQEENRSVEDIHTQVRSLAYQLWLDRGAPIGSPEEDWSEAEARLTYLGTTPAPDQ